jgi:hypothetical protein
MENCNNHIIKMTGRDSKKPCCAPISESLGCITWLQTVSPSDKVFMTIGFDIDQSRNYSERELCSSSFSEMLIDQNGRRVNSCPSSISLQMMEQRWNNDRMLYQTKYLVSHVYKELHSTIHQSCSLRTTLTSVALKKENLFVDISMDKRLK